MTKDDRIYKLAIEAGFDLVDVRQAFAGDDNPYVNFVRLLLEHSTEVMERHDYHGRWLGDKLVEHYFGSQE